MTIDEACVEVVAETKTRTWNECNDTLRALVVKTIFEQVIAEPEQSAKKVKQRKPRKSKTKTDYPAMTQYAGLEASE